MLDELNQVSSAECLNALYEITHPKKKTFKQKVKDFFKKLWYATTNREEIK